MQATTNIEAIIGGSVGGCLLALCLLIAGCIWWRRCGRKHPDDRGRAVPCDYTGIEMQHRQEPGPAPRVSSRPATPPSTPDPASWTFPKKISDDGLCTPLMDTQDPGPPNNAHDVHEKEANHPLQPIPLQPEDQAGPAGGRGEPVGSSRDDVSFRSPVQNV
ncbi:uncharacterized protein LOC118431168 [Branchiostoma floridae]|uniref:Uncharacterized protein LOC118431168 n=1 Tax=Branchiostoma floridae TaxID=7739 RepID=A0A9J7NC26_BRAFL|nr:uncharacterized protein LOC118431168 [Branchiostoma floridae]